MMLPKNLRIDPPKFSATDRKRGPRTKTIDAPQSVVQRRRRRTVRRVRDLRD